MRPMVLAVILMIGCGKKDESPSVIVDKPSVQPQEKPKMEAVLQPMPKTFDPFPLAVTIRRYTGKPTPVPLPDEENKFEEPIKDVKARLENRGSDAYFVLPPSFSGSLAKGSEILSGKNTYQLRADAQRTEGGLECSIVIRHHPAK
jgi:hypothetical protein